MSFNSATIAFPDQQSVYHGKVRDVYDIAGKYILLLASDRISAFDHILPKPIPCKGQVLNQTAAYFLDATKDIVPNWLLGTPDPNVSIGKKCETIPLEMVVRGYLAGHAWRVYKGGGRIVCGVPLPEGLKENDKLPHPIITPSTKAMEGHDMDISEAEILSQNIVTAAEWQTLCDYTMKLFQRGTEMAADRGLILVDTKYEFGKDAAGNIVLIDEVHTPDSSRYFYGEGYADRQANGEAQKQLSKEFVREWLMENGFQGLENQTMPDMPDSFVSQITARYIELYETITGQTFVPRTEADVQSAIEQNVQAWLAAQ